MNLSAGTIAKVSGIAAVSYIASKTMFTVPAGHRGLVFQELGDKKGVLKKVCPEGINFLVPILQRPILMDVRIKPLTISTKTGTKDLQQVKLSMRILSRPEEEKLTNLFEKVGMNYNEKILNSIGPETLKSVVANYNADQLLTLREKVSAEIRSDMMDACSKFNLKLENIAITHLEFSEENQTAIENKQVAEQNAEKSKYLVAKAEQERQALIIRSEGDAEAAQKVSDALAKSGRGYIEIRRMETAKKVAELLSDSPNVTYLPQSDAGGDGKSSGGQGQYLLNIGR